MPRMRKKAELPQKICRSCGLTFIWRKKWQRDWPSVLYCSERCRRRAPRALEEAPPVRRGASRD